ELLRLSNSELRERLLAYREDGGPVTDFNRSLNLHKLAHIEMGREARIRLCEPFFTSCPPDVHFLVANVAKALDAYEALEREMVLDFETPRPEGHWREGNSKTSFNYLLLDSRVTRNLPVRARGLPLAEQVSDFVRGVFYVGKGKRSRPFSHLHDALVVWNGTAKAWQTAGDKTHKILQIWEAGCGVVSLHVFQNVLPAEAYTREACIIEALTKRRLTNAKKGDCYGVVGSWSEKARKKLGAFLVFKAFQIFLSEGERRLGPLDL
ncbi:unnamed protein product, partial [Ixodes persulcatus]